VAVVIVTHDLAEAATVADRTLVVDRIHSRSAATIVDVVERDPVIEKTVARLSLALAAKTEETHGALQTHVAHRRRPFDLDDRVVAVR
jgi:ABC-type nitrate/sulfonate/bicarbonate transport system ATPase subunit